MQSARKDCPLQTEERVDPLDLLLSSSEDETVRSVRVKDKGSATQGVRVLLQGVPTIGIVDSGADITIVGGDLLRKVAAVARLKK